MIDESCLQRIPEAYNIPTLEGFSKDETSVALAAEMMERRGPPLPSLHLPSSLSSVGYQVGSSSSSFGLMDFDMPELHDVPITSSSQVQIQGSSSSAQIKEDHPPPYKVDTICNEIGVCRSEALYYLQGFDWDLASAMEACRKETLPPLKAKSLPVVSLNEVSVAPTSGPVVMNSRRISNTLRIQPEQLPPKEDELLSDTKAESIKQFCEFTRVAPGFAVSYLESCKWNVQNAIISFMEEPERIIPSETVTSKALPSQSQFQTSGSSSSSFINVDPTETEASLEEASDESVPVAISPLASSQVDGNLKGSAVEEDSSTEAVLAAPDTITTTIILLDGIEAKIPFRFDQTVRDIRNAIDALRPDASKNYDLMSADSIEDLNTTVKKLSKGSTSLVQVQRD
ncbi:PREDICTED: plant UBX domain-containing protein 6-like [Camelina sativa]|uniref:Plant UBX domain-containing protein 6-like n=1 Tax=Camelina sativa TaxID=90675 RepID=A0ABM0Z3K7_CAMSA|nr:PREDICTED: plant UBX domain-containing protein 6-like [Camelina sativa]